MSLKILRQQLKDLVEEEKPVVKKTRKEKRKAPLKEDKFTKSRKSEKKNTKPKGPIESITSSVDRIKNDINFARERQDNNLKWNMKIIDAVSSVDGTEVMNKYLKKKGLLAEEKGIVKKKKTTAKSSRIKSKAIKNSVPSAFSWS